ncbi:helix-turn-helix transcriptional regulator [Arenimonas sp.]|uniref:helix-turn-helix transcriptional regulator n=1 Tax=Arenimonas sp. TaxID=1872635 RepID=UPI0039E2D529
MASTLPQPPTRHSILRLPDVKARTGLSRSTIYLRVAQKTFPTPINLGGRAVGWLEAEIEDWLAQQIAESRKATP